MNSEIYVEAIMERYKNPVNKGAVNDSDAVARDSNPSCGDVIEIQIKFNGEKINEIKFQGEGCAISQSCADVLVDMIKGGDVGRVKDISTADFMQHLGIEISPLRLKCALLGLKTLKTAVYTYLGR